MRFIACFRRDESGSVAVIFASVIVAVLVVVGMGVDYGRKIALEAQVQQALDLAVLAAVKIDEGSRQDRARKYFDAGLASKDAENVQVNFVSEGANKVSGTARAEIKTTLTGLLGVSKLTIETEAVAEADGGAPVCVLALATNASQQLLFNSGANINAPDCEVHAKSTASPAAVFNAGTTLDTARICLASKNVLDNGGSHPRLQLGCEAASDPFAGKLPIPHSASCTFSNGNYNGGNVTLAPGVYCGWFNFNNSPNVTFQPGVYVIKNGGWNVNGGNWSGNGVTFYYADQSKIQFNSGVAAVLEAPKTGTYANIVMYEAPNLGVSPFIFNDSKAMDMRGLVYLPSRDVTFNANSSITARQFALVVNTLILNQTKWVLTPVKGISGGGDGKSVRLTH